MVRQFYDNNPNKSVLNLILAAVTIMGLWNVWFSPSSESEERMTLLRLSDRHRDVEETQAYTALSPQYTSLSDGSSQRALPLQTINGRRVVLISTPRQLSPSIDTSSSIMLTPDHSVVSQKVTQSVNMPRRASNISSSQKHAKVSVPPSKGDSRRNRTTHILVAMSCSIVAGALMAKKALDKLHKWEQQSQEDSLVFDMAYTTSAKELLGYGSFFSAWNGDLDKYDV